MSRATSRMARICSFPECMAEMTPTDGPQSPTAKVAETCATRATALGSTTEAKSSAAGMDR